MRIFLCWNRLAPEGKDDRVPAVRLGLSYVRTIGAEMAKRIAAGRPYISIEDFVRRSGVSVAQAEALATAGAFDCFGLARREALWAAGAIAQSGAGLEGNQNAPQTTARGGGGAPLPGGAWGWAEPERESRQTPGAGVGAPVSGGKGPSGASRATSTAPAGDRRPRQERQAARLAGLVTGAEAPPLPGMNAVEINRADLWATGLSPDSYPTELFRKELDALGIMTAASLGPLPNGRPVIVGGLVTHRQHPMTAKGVVFINLEDETGLVNVICPVPIWERYKQVARSAPALLVRGKLERDGGAINVLAARIEALPPLAGLTALRSRDFR